MIKSTAYKRVEKARTQLSITSPFFGTLALHLQMVETDTVDTMAVDGVNLFFNPKFVTSISEVELLGVNVHEVLHCAYNHMTRRGAREPERWNFACDFVVNSEVLKSGFALPPERLFDPKYDGMSAEEVYERLPPTPLGSGGWCIGEVLDAAPPHDKTANAAMAEHWEANVKMAVGTAKAAGQLPAGHERLADHLKKPKVNWRDLTREFIDGSMSRDFSWLRPNRRHVHSGLYLPGYIPDAMNHLICCLDNSGSISESLIAAMLGETAQCLDDGLADKLTVIYADAAVQHVDEFYPGDVVKPKPVPGGGGTSFNDTFKWINQNAPDVSCIIYLTDMDTCGWGEDPGCPVLWGAYVPSHRLGLYKPPFGTSIAIDTSH